MHDFKLVGIDLSKSSFQIHESTKSGRVLGRSKKTRSQMPKFFMNLPKDSVVLMEACGSANFWARKAISYGHTVKLIAPQYVKPFVKSQKNDAADAEAICEAGSRENMRFVPVKSIAQQDLQLMHRIRSRHVGNRTALYNQMRSILAEYGISVKKGMSHIRTTLESLIANDPIVNREDLTDVMLDELSGLFLEAKNLDAKIASYDAKLEAAIKNDERCGRLIKLPGIGPVTATAVVAAAGNCSEFKNSRQFAAWLGLVPRQNSTGGKTCLLGLTKRGDKYLRTLLIHGARAVLMNTGEKKDPRSIWANQLKSRVGMNKAAVAMANKNARTIWSILQRGIDYDPQYHVKIGVKLVARQKAKKRNSPPAISSSLTLAAPIAS